MSKNIFCTNKMFSLIFKTYIRVRWLSSTKRKKRLLTVHKFFLIFQTLHLLKQKRFITGKLRTCPFIKKKKKIQFLHTWGPDPHKVQRWEGWRCLPSPPGTSTPAARNSSATTSTMRKKQINVVFSFLVSLWRLGSATQNYRWQNGKVLLLYHLHL